MSSPVEVYCDGWKPERPCILIGADWQDLPLEWAQDREYAVGRRRGQPQGAQTFHGQLVGPDAWDLDDDPAVAQEEIAVTLDALQRARLPWALTASQVAGRISRRLALSPGPIPVHLAQVMRDALHQGPQLIARGGADVATEWDLREAYLSALDEPVPVPGSWRRVDDPTWARVEQLDGVAVAVVEVPYMQLPPLPVATKRAGTLWPAGRIYGSWPLHWLRAAVELGATVERLDRVWSCRTACLLRPLHDRIKAIDDKRTRRAIYTRAWGRYAGLGHWRGWWDKAVRARPSGKVVEDVFLWTRVEPAPEDWPIDFRPDWAAWVASRTAIRVVRAVATLPDDRLVAAHIDAIVVAEEGTCADGPNKPASGGPTPPGGAWVPPELHRWKLKRTGPIRAYATGTWTHDGVCTAQGWTGTATPEGLADAAARGRMFAYGTRAARVWMGDPVYQCEATSQPLIVEMDDGSDDAT